MNLFFLFLQIILHELRIELGQIILVGVLLLEREVQIAVMSLLLVNLFPDSVDLGKIIVSVLMHYCNFI